MDENLKFLWLKGGNFRIKEIPRKDLEKKMEEIKEKYIVNDEIFNRILSIIPYASQLFINWDYFLILDMQVVFYYLKGKKDGISMSSNHKILKALLEISQEGEIISDDDAKEMEILASTTV